MYCLHASIQKKDSSFGRIFDISKGNLHKIQFNIQCSLENNFTRGHDTNQILKFILTQIKDKFPWIKNLMFNDASERTCDNGEIISLATLSYLTTGKTWYEKNFGAFLEPSAQKEFKQKEAKFQEQKQKLSWEMMKESIQGNLPLPEEDMKQLQEESKTWQDFFGGLRDKAGIAEVCEFLSPWVSDFIHQFFEYEFMKTKYVMPVVSYPIQQTITEQQRGGKRLTRRYLRKSLRKQK